MDDFQCFECVYFNPDDECCEHPEVGFIGANSEDPACGYFGLTPEFEPV